MRKDKGERQTFKVDVPFACEPRIDRHQVVLPTYLQAVAREVKERHICMAQLLAELTDCPLHRALIEVAALDDIETQAFQRRRHIGRVVPGVFEFWCALVGRVADHEGNALLLSLIHI